MGTTTTTTTTRGNKSVSTTVTKDRLGSAWIPNPNKKAAKSNPWVKPAVPSDNGKTDSNGNVIQYAWDDNNGWVSNTAQAAAWKVPLAIIQSVPQLEALFNEAWAAMKKGTEWTEEQFTVRLQALDWYKEKSAAQRKYYYLEHDPAQAEELASQIASTKATVSALAQQLGTTMSDSELTDFATNALRNGLNQDEITSSLSAHISYGGQSLGQVAGSLFGKAGDLEDGIRDWAKRNGVTVSDSWVLDQVKHAASSGLDISRAKDTITNIAKNTYSHWADKLDGINTLDDLASGIKNIVSDEMDVDYKTLDMNNEYVKAAMQAKDDKGMPIGNDAVRKTLMKTNAWADVEKNKNKLISAGQDILNRMGIM